MFKTTLNEFPFSKQLVISLTNLKMQRLTSLEHQADHGKTFKNSVFLQCHSRYQVADV